MTELSPLLALTPDDFKSSTDTDESVGSLIPNSAAKVISTEDDSGEKKMLLICVGNDVSVLGNWHFWWTPERT